MNIKKWIGYEFESSSSLTKEFADFNRQVKSFIKAQTKELFEIVSWNKGHFYFSGFLKNKETGKFIYFSCSDVRHFKDEWYNSLLIRTAEHDKDYTGGANNIIGIEIIKERAIDLLK